MRHIQLAAVLCLISTQAFALGFIQRPDPSPQQAAGGGAFLAAAGAVAAPPGPALPPDVCSGLRQRVAQGFARFAGAGEPTVVEGEAFGLYGSFQFAMARYDRHCGGASWLAFEAAQDDPRLRQTMAALKKACGMPLGGDGCRAAADAHHETIVPHFQTIGGRDD